MSATLFSLAFGVGTQNRQGDWLEVFYAQPLLQPAGELVAAVAPLLGYAGYLPFGLECVVIAAFFLPSQARNSGENQRG